MKITAIKQQMKRAGRYSIFVDDKYAFSLSDSALLESRLVTGQELTPTQIGELKQAADDDKLYNLTLRYLALRPRSRWEVEFYLQRKKASPTLTDSILNKLSILNLINDEEFARIFVANRRLLRPTSRRKITNELRQKHLATDIIEAAVGNETVDESSALQTIITQKRKQSRYQDELKLMQYLARQGFSYGDIKAALQHDSLD